MSKWSFEGSFQFSGREYEVKVSGDPKKNVNQGLNAVGVIARQGSAVSLFRQGDQDEEPWVFMAGKPAVFKAAQTILPRR